MNKKDRQFIETVFSYYNHHGRHDLPWRHTTASYRIVVSEIMLQQTQVARVQEKYRSFLYCFPNTKQLATASLADVLRSWQGLGYNRRAKLLKQAAEQIHYTRRGRWPQTYAELCALPGIGPYTAGAVMAFAHNIPIPIIETNIRTVILHHYFPQVTQVSDSDIRAVVERTLSLDNPRQWYWALMDYGAYLKQTYGGRNQQSKHYHKQSAFKGSVRQLRGTVLRLLTTRSSLQLADITSASGTFSAAQIHAVLQALCAEGLLEKVGDRYRLPL